MIVFLWFSMVTFVILFGFGTLAVVGHHYWKESRKAAAARRAALAESDSSLTAP